MAFRFQERQIRFGGRIYTITRKRMLFAAAAGICICIAVGSVIHEQAKKTPISAESGSAAPGPTPAGQTPRLSAPPSSKPAGILLHVAGAIQEPGLIRIPAGARVADAIEAAGGFTESADPGSLNLAAPVYDGMKLYIPCIGETPAIFLPAPTGSANREGTPAKININTAGIAELTALDGIGEATAKKIIAYREEHGKFQKSEELLQVNGIGNAKYEAIKDCICL